MLYTFARDAIVLILAHTGTAFTAEERREKGYAMRPSLLSPSHQMAELASEALSLASIAKYP